MKRRKVDVYTGPKTLGLDVSRYQGDIDWTKVNEDFKFVFIRTGDGRGRDKKFFQNWEGAGKEGLHRGVYHYFRADRDGKTQAESVIEMLEQAGGLTLNDLPPVIDIEGGTALNLPGGVFESADVKNLPIEVIVEECLEFLEEIEKKLGVRPIVYTGQAFHWWLSQARPLLAAEFEDYPLWIASYARGDAPYMPVNTAGDGFPWSVWTFWQWTSKGESEGISGPIDVNYFRGDAVDLAQFVSDSWNYFPEEAPPEEPKIETIPTFSFVDPTTQKLDEILHVLRDMRRLLEK